MHERPPAVKIKSELGMSVTLGSGPGCFQRLRNGSGPVFLGLGPDPALLEKMYPGLERFYFIECPELEDQMDESWKQKISHKFSRIDPEKLGPEDVREMGFVLYSPGLKYFPGFWAHVLAGIRMSHTAGSIPQDKPQGMLIFGTERSLLVPELCWEAENLGLRPVLADPGSGPEELMALLKQFRPVLVLSINFQGLDQLGENFALLRRMNIPVAVWMVDNPFHLLTAVKGRYWTMAGIFVTDHWFVSPLKELGASQVHHLPLAAGPGFFSSVRSNHHDLGDKVVFVGRSSFPGSRSFFAAAGRHPGLQAEASGLLEKGKRPDFAWWSQKIKAPYWPGNRVRDMGRGAEIAGLEWKKMCLEKLEGRYPLVVYGDKAWEQILSKRVSVRAEVDYYGPLASIYSSSRYILNLTNMHLPWGLTQRHFDVWAAKGFLVSDRTRGLEIFPRELVREMSFSSSKGMLEVMARLDNDSALSKNLTSEFEKLIKKGHTYRQRLEVILELTGVNS